MAWASDAARSSSTEHKAWAAQVRRNARGHCQLRLAGCTGTVDQADHITPVAEGGEEFDPANGQGVCDHCHGIKTSAEAARGRRRMFAKAKHPQERHPSLPRRS